MSHFSKKLREGAKSLVRPKTSRQAVFSIVFAVVIAAAVAMLVFSHRGASTETEWEYLPSVIEKDARTLELSERELMVEPPQEDPGVHSFQTQLEEATEYLLFTDNGFRILCLADFTLLFLLALVVLSSAVRKGVRGRSTLKIEIEDKRDDSRRCPLIADYDEEEDADWVSVKDLNLETDTDDEDNPFGKNFS